MGIQFQEDQNEAIPDSERILTIRLAVLAILERDRRTDRQT